MKSPILSLFFCLYSVLSFAQTGIPTPTMSACDDLVLDFLATHDIPGATFALAKDGRLAYLRAFGHADLAGNETTQPYHLFRIASVSKPITAIAMMKLVEEGELSLNDKVFGAGGLLENHPVFSDADITDNRIFDITVRHLLEHSAGWNREVNCFPQPTSPYPWSFDGCDPIVAPLHVTQELGMPNPASEESLIRFLLEKGLNFNPGTDYAYSNIGFLVLGEIIEELSGLSYEDYVKNTILSPLGICDMHIGKNLLEDKMEREGEYTGNDFTTLSCYGTGELVPWEYGGFNLEAMDAHGGWIATARDLVRLLVAIDGFSSKPDILAPATISNMVAPSANNLYYAKGWSVNPANNWWHTGSLDGTASFFGRSNNGYTWAVILNKRQFSSNFWSDLDNLPWSCIANTNTFPAHDLMDLPLTNSSGISFPAVAAQSISASWNPGDGTHRLLVIKKGGPVNAFPLDGTTYAAGDDLGNGCFVAYNGSGNNAQLDNLDTESTYHFRLFEYNLSANTGNYPLYMLCNSEQASTTTLTTAVAETHSNSWLQVFPTPAANQLTVSVSTGFFPGTEYSICNLSGATLLQGSLPTPTHTINIGALPSGFYYIRVSNRNQYELQKFVKN